MIIDKHTPSKIWQWGSLLHPENFREYSDIDIALEGVKDVESFFALYGDAMKMTDFRLHIMKWKKSSLNLLKLSDPRVK